MNGADDQGGSTGQEQGASGDEREQAPLRWQDKLGWTFLALLAPFMLAWTSWCFWRLATVGRLYVDEGGTIVDAEGGLLFWVTLGLYVVLWFASIVMIVAAIGWLRRKLGKGR